MLIIFFCKNFRIGLYFGIYPFESHRLIPKIIYVTCVNYHPMHCRKLGIGPMSDEDDDKIEKLAETFHFASILN